MLPDYRSRTAARKSKRRPRPTSVVTKSLYVLVALSLVYPTIPNQYTYSWFIGGRASITYVCVVAVLVSFLHWLQLGPLSRLWVVSSATLLALLALLGLLLSNTNFFSWGALEGDVLVMAGLLVGVGFARFLAVERGMWLLCTVYCLGLVAFGATMGGWAAGVIHVSETHEGRRVISSLFGISWVLTAICPIVFSLRGTLRSRSRRTGLLCVVFLGIASVFYIGFFTSTRSVLLQGVCMLLLCTALHLAKAVNGLAVSLVVVAVLVLSASINSVVEAGSSVYDRYILSKRPVASSFEGETRAVEVGLMMSEMRWDVVIGWGFGSQFPTEGQGYLVSGPHVGALTFLMKGGFALFGLFCIGPLILALLKLRNSQDWFVRGGAGGVIAFVWMASMSGGWSFMNVFLYGYSIGVVVYRSRRAGFSRSAALVPARMLPRQVSLPAEG